MPPKEVDDNDRATINRYISLLYAEAYLKGDLDKLKKDNNPIFAAFNEQLTRNIEVELFQQRRQMQSLGIKVTNTRKGTFEALVRGQGPITSVFNGEMAQKKAMDVLKELYPHLFELDEPPI